MVVYYQPSANYIWDYDGVYLFNGKELICKNQVEVNVMVRFGMLVRLGEL